MREDPSAGVYQKKIDELQKEVKRLSHKKTKTEICAAAEKRTAIESKMKMESEFQKTAIDAKMQTEFETQLFAVEEEKRKRLGKMSENKSRNQKISRYSTHLILLVLIILVGSAGITVQHSTTTNYPYIITYNIWFPIDEPVDIINHKLIALSDDNEMMFSFNGNVTKLICNDPIAIDEQATTLTTLFGRVSIMTINYKVTLEYRGNTEENHAYFEMFIQSDKFAPEFVINFMLPKNVVVQKT
jgi:hypothetical protein